MCGIAGIFGFEDTTLLKRMLNIIKHRGPDDEGTFSDDSASLGVRRLAIVDIERGKQPMHNEEETVWIVFNGEIYNFPEVRDELIRLGHRFETRTDTETTVHAYEQWGTDCLQKLNGMFAFAIWDKNKRRLFLARDRIGIKPLYYYGTPKRFLFASEIKALITDPNVTRKPNDQAVCEFLLAGFQSHVGMTFFADIKELPPAHYMTVDQNQLTLKRYWNLNATEPKESRTDEYYATQFRGLLLDAIKVRLPVNLAIGSFLSGGLDSTSIVCLADSLLKSNPPSLVAGHNPQKLFSAFYHEAVADERPFIEEVGRAVRTPIDYVFPSDTMDLEDIKTFVYYMDEPVTVLNYYVYWCLARITKKHVRVTFSGQGPDEILAGHSDHFQVYVKELWKTRRFKKLLTEIIAGLGRYGPRSVLKSLIETLTPTKPQAKDLLDPRFVTSYKPDRLQKEGSLRTALLADLTRNRLPMHLRVGDRVSSAFCTETRCPYLDHKVVEYSFLLPESQKIKNGWGKYVLRNAVKGIVPESVRKRGKLGTPVPLDRWMKNLHHDISRILRSDRFRDRGYFNQPRVLEVYDRYYKGMLKRSERQFYGDVLWRILNVELWFEVFFDQPSSRHLNITLTELR
jgi:asparagine synthase (glutamine-hydrolysing)